MHQSILPPVHGIPPSLSLREKLQVEFENALIELPTCVPQGDQGQKGLCYF